MKNLFFYKKSKSPNTTSEAYFRRYINNFLFPIAAISALLLSACQGPIEATLDTSRLSETCKNKLVSNEFIVKFKHESTYRTVKAEDAQTFFNDVVQPMEEQIEQYGLNFKFTHHNELSKFQRRRTFEKATTQPWVKALTRSEFLTHHGYFGQGVKIAVLDTGIDLRSAAFQNLLARSDSDFKGYNFAESNTDVQDYNGHGTMVSALIAAPESQAFNGETFEGGLAPQAELLPVKIFARDTRVTDLSTILKGLDYAISQKVDIINASWGGSDNCSALLENKLFEVWTNSILFVTSAGDSAKNLTHKPDFPASFNIPTMVVVSGINRNLEIPGRANYGGLVNLFAPSQDVPTLGLNHELVVESGTSLASAIAAGGAALLKSAFPDVALHTLSYALTHGSSVANPTAEMNIMDLKSSYLHLSSLQLLPQPQP
ncbi:MAG: S8 family serine peptidase [Bdellovibrionaceae bacterium]|nr:S8 family serine peptidase [Pseudobdellovibrionaceae bacterium]